MQIEFFKQDKQFPVHIKFNSCKQLLAERAAIELHKKLGDMIKENFVVKNETNTENKRAICKGMPHGSCKGETMCDTKNACFEPVENPWWIVKKNGQ
jgi:hypothetical protein